MASIANVTVNASLARIVSGAIGSGLIGMAAIRGGRMIPRRAYTSTVGPDHLDEEERKVHEAFVAAAGGPHAKANPELAENMTGLKLSHMEENLDPVVEKEVVGDEEQYEVFQAFKHSVSEGHGHDASRDIPHP